MCQHCYEEGLYEADAKAQEAQQQKSFFDKRLLRFRLMGEFFGYPKCCIDWFVNRSANIMKASTEEEIYKAALVDKSQEGFKEGFVPCPECAKKVQPGQEGTLIESTRVCTKSFPRDEVPYQEFEEFVKSRVS